MTTATRSILDALDLSQARRQRLELKRVNVDFPLWMVEQLDRAGGIDRLQPPVIKAVLA